MKTIHILDQYKRVHDTIFEFRPLSGHYTIGSEFQLIESGNKNFITNAILVSSEIVKINEICNYHSYACKGVDIHTFKQMLTYYDDDDHEVDTFCFLIFSNHEYNKKFYVDAITYEEQQKINSLNVVFDEFN
tara:strand:+ start:22935 stop:23330 length:396 start_codon:yes stop_codon:yes gene_type:complete